MRIQAQISSDSVPESDVHNQYPEFLGPVMGTTRGHGLMARGLGLNIAGCVAPGLINWVSINRNIALLVHREKRLAYYEW